MSFALGLQGPCAMIDTACSAGLVATSFARGALVLRELEEASQAELEEHEEAELEELRAAAEEFDKLELGTDGMECPCCRSGVVRADGGETVACDHCDLGVCVGGVGGDGGSHSSGEGALDVLRARLGASLGAHSATGCTAAPAFALHRRAGAVTLQLVCDKGRVGRLFWDEAR